MMSINVISTVRIDLKYLTGLLNSKLIEFWLKNKGKMQGNNYQIDKEPLINLPIFNPSKEEKDILISIVEKIISIAGNEDYTINSNKQIIVKEYEKQIDQIVYKLYGLTKEEIEVVEEK